MLHEGFKLKTPSFTKKSELDKIGNNTEFYL